MTNKNAIIVCILCLFALALVSSCVNENFQKIKTEDYVGKTLSLRGTVQNPYMIGGLSGYTLVDKFDETMQVKSQTVLKSGETATVKGVLIKDSIFGYYLLVK